MYNRQRRKKWIEKLYEQFRQLVRARQKFEFIDELTENQQEEFKKYISFEKNKIDVWSPREINTLLKYFKDVDKILVKRGEFKQIDRRSIKKTLLPHSSECILMTFDIEAYQVEISSSEKRFVPYMLRTTTFNLFKNETESKIFYKKTDQSEIVTQFMDYLIEKRKESEGGIYIWAHNFRKYDGKLILNDLISHCYKKWEDEYHNISIVLNDKSIYRVKIVWGEDKKDKIVFFCSLLLFKSSLAKIAKIYLKKTRKRIIPFDYINPDNIESNVIPSLEERGLNKKNYDIFIKDWKEFCNNKEKPTLLTFVEKYCKEDSYILAKSLQVFLKTVGKLDSFKLNSLITLPKMAFQHWRSTYFNWKYPLCVITPERQRDKFIRKAYFGGRTEVFAGKKIDKHEFVYQYDIRGMYSQCMQQMLPYGNPLRVLGYKGNNFEEFIKELKKDHNIVGFFEVSIKTPTIIEMGERPPVLPVFHQKKLLFPLGEFKGTYYSEELLLAIEQGYQILNCRKGYIFKRGPVLERYSTHKIKLKDKYTKEGKEVSRKIHKLFNNSLYGKFAAKYIFQTTRLLNKQQYEKLKDMYISDNIIPLEKEKYIVTYKVLERLKKTNLTRSQKTALKGEFYKSVRQGFVKIAIAAAITSIGRTMLYNCYLKIIKKGGYLYYRDTDRCIASFDKSPQGMYLFTKDATKEKVTWLKKEEEKKYSKALFLAPKMYGLLGVNGKETIKIKGAQNTGIDFRTLLKRWNDGYLKVKEVQAFRGSSLINVDLAKISKTFRYIKRQKREYIFTDGKWTGETVPFVLDNVTSKKNLRDIKKIKVLPREVIAKMNELKEEMISCIISKKEDFQNFSIELEGIYFSIKFVSSKLRPRLLFSSPWEGIDEKQLQYIYTLLVKGWIYFSKSVATGSVIMTKERDKIIGKIKLSNSLTVSPFHFTTLDDLLEVGMFNFVKAHRIRLDKFMEEYRKVMDLPKTKIVGQLIFKKDDFVPKGFNINIDQIISLKKKLWKMRSAYSEELTLEKLRKEGIKKWYNKVKVTDNYEKKIERIINMGLKRKAYSSLRYGTQKKVSEILYEIVKSGNFSLKSFLKKIIFALKMKLPNSSSPLLDEYKVIIKGSLELVLVLEEMKIIERNVMSTKKKKKIRIRSYVIYNVKFKSPLANKLWLKWKEINRFNYSVIPKKDISIKKIYRKKVIKILNEQKIFIKTQFLQWIVRVIKGHFKEVYSNLIIGGKDEKGINVTLKEILDIIKHLSAITKGFTIPYYNTFKIDFRGRIYPKDPVFSPQGRRFIRPLFLLSPPIREKVWTLDKINNKDTYLRYISSLCGKKIMRVEEGLEFLINVRNEVRENHWEIKSRIFEIINLVKEGESIISPLQIDGKCKAFQHLSALIKDENIGRIVSVYPEGKSKFKDIYMILVQQIYEKAVNPQVKEALNIIGPSKMRSIIKKSVMTIFYGVTVYTAMIKIRSSLTRYFNVYELNKVVHIKVLYKYIKEQYGLFRRNKKDFKKYSDLFSLLKSTPSSAMGRQWYLNDGFIVNNEYYKKLEVDMKVVYNKVRLHTSFKYPMYEKDLNKMRKRVAAKLVHSLDSLHLKMIILTCKDQNISVYPIHDCILVNLEKYNVVQGICMETFKVMYRTNILERLLRSLRKGSRVTRIDINNYLKSIEYYSSPNPEPTKNLFK